MEALPSKNTLTNSQQKVFDQIQSFIQSPEKQVFILTGYAGTGKTFLLQQLARYLKSEKQQFSLLAPTGRAAAVLRSKTDFTATTIHSELYKFSKVDGDDEHIPDDAEVDKFGQMLLVFGRREYDDEETEKIYIVDEASMVSNIKDKLNTYAHFGSGYLLSDLMHTVHRNKIIFTGDPAQLPPIGDQLGPALQMNWFRENQYLADGAVLEEVLRQKEGSGILELATEVRHMLHQQFSTRWIKLPAKGHREIRLLPATNMLEQYWENFSKDKEGKTIAISNSNRNCLVINQFIRRKKYGDKDADIQTGDVLMVTQNNYLVPLVNGDFVEITKKGEIQVRSGFRFQNVTVKAQHNKKEYNILLCIETLFQDKGNLLPEQQRLLMIDFSRRMRRKRIRPNSEMYKQVLHTDPYLNSLRTSYGYAATCHKAQGGEWDTVFLFLQKGMYVMKPHNLIRWWYTAITRAKKELFITADWWII